MLAYCLGLRCVGNFSVRSTPDETTVVTVDASETTALYERNEQKSELPAPVEDGLLADGPENNGYSPKEALDTNQPLKFLEDLDIKLPLDGEDVYPLLVLGGGGVVALSLLAGITGAIDSIPLLPKVLELVGLGYSLWFTTRYLIFKENRDELVDKFEKIKQQIVGSEND
ncbi:hypothetical protein M569_14608 [Genlisea aurea]|uniref:Cyanobacterial aminoacyl-tRNA synthetase CAAD domain-containing protein n=1 Tax=Genlisea aurea TaxID=192259 RepID=S8C710_9LAMI|nr:hypothetical protein M569_14608 [Genlisea aurea]